MDKVKLMQEICDWYNYKLKTVNDKVVVFDSIRIFEYDDMDEALKDWLDTLLESNYDYFECEGEEYGTWDKETIDFIESL